jgi:hypothetical protein
LKSTVALLPATKEQIKLALVLLARHSERAGASHEDLTPPRVAYAHLADFVSEAEARAVAVFDEAAAMNAGELDDEGLRELAAKIANADLSPSGVLRESTSEFERLTAEFDARVHK